MESPFFWKFLQFFAIQVRLRHLLMQRQYCWHQGLDLKDWWVWVQVLPQIYVKQRSIVCAFRISIWLVSGKVLRQKWVLGFQERSFTFIVSNVLTSWTALCPSSIGNETSGPLNGLIARGAWLFLCPWILCWREKLLDPTILEYNRSTGFMKGSDEQGCRISWNNLSTKI
jgi:hypothetical protein